jgi:hypothetical protein
MRINYVLSTSLLTCAIGTSTEIMTVLSAKGHRVSITRPVRPGRSFVGEGDAILRMLAHEGSSERLRKAEPSKAKESTLDKTTDGFDRVFCGEIR